MRSTDAGRRPAASCFCRVLATEARRLQEGGKSRQTAHSIDCSAIRGLPVTAPNSKERESTYPPFSSPSAASRTRVNPPRPLRPGVPPPSRPAFNMASPAASDFGLDAAPEPDAHAAPEPDVHAASAVLEDIQEIDHEILIQRAILASLQDTVHTPDIVERTRRAEAEIKRLKKRLADARKQGSTMPLLGRVPCSWLLTDGRSCLQRFASQHELQHPLRSVSTFLRNRVFSAHGHRPLIHKTDRRPDRHPYPRQPSGYSSPFSMSTPGSASSMWSAGEQPRPSSRLKRSYTSHLDGENNNAPGNKSQKTSPSPALHAPFPPPRTESPVFDLTGFTDGEVIDLTRQAQLPAPR